MSPTIALFAIGMNLFALAACVWIIVSLSSRRPFSDPMMPRRDSHRDPSRHRTDTARL